MHSPFVDQTLDNGLRVVIERMPDVSSAAAGFFARTGGRDETPDMIGVSHFLEHMCFKGTPKRTWSQLNIDFDNLGSQYNAYTMKDRTFYYGWVPADSIAEQIEVIADMMRSTLPQAEFDTEKQVILEEIAMAHDHIDNLAYEFMHEQLFPGHPLAWPILGYENTVEDMTREQMLSYFESRYTPDNMVLIVAGKVDPRKMIDVANDLCGEWQPGTMPHARATGKIQPGKSCKVYGRFNQQVMANVFAAPGGEDQWDVVADVVASVLGGENSRFYWNIVQAGVAPRAGVWRIDYSECGLMMLSGQCEPAGCERLAEAMNSEALKLTRDGASEEEVQRVKNRKRTNIALESEAPYYRLGQILDDVDYRKGPRTVQERLAEVDAITPQTIAEYLERYPLDNGGHFVSVGPRDWIPAD